MNTHKSVPISDKKYEKKLVLKAIKNFGTEKKNTKLKKLSSLADLA